MQKYGVREICNIVFKAQSDMKIGTMNFVKGQPVLYMDTAKTSTVEGNATTVYATGGRGNNRLIAWEGERQLTFNVEDALLSPISMAMLTGAGLVKGASDSTAKTHFHMSASAMLASVTGGGIEIDLTNALGTNDTICGTAPIYVVRTDKEDGALTGEVISGFEVDTDGKKLVASTGTLPTDGNYNVFVDFYVLKADKTVNELQIDMEHFGGYFYVEANSLWRDTKGQDHAVELTFPNVKIQSNFTFNYAATGDPSTFQFTMDAFPGYTYFNQKKKVLLAMQVLDETENASYVPESIFGPHSSTEDFD